MRTATVWVIAGVCGTVAFGSALVSRAPSLVDDAGRPVRPTMRTMAASGMLPREIPALLDFLKDNPQHLRARYWLALRYELEGRPEEAREAWRAAAALVPELLERDPEGRRAPFAHFVRAEAQRQLGERDGGHEAYETALRLYGQVLDRRPHDHRAVYYMAWCATRLGDPIGSRKYWSQLEGLASDERADAETLYNLAAARALLGRPDDALDAVQVLLLRGFDDRLRLARSEEFITLRDEPRFQAALRWLEERETSKDEPPEPPRRATF